MTLDFVKLEDNRNYAIVNAIEVNGNRYLFLAYENDPTDLAIRKVITKDNKEYLTKLDSDEEYDSVMNAFMEKNRKDSKDEK